MDALENETDRIGFNSSVDSVIIVLSDTLKYFHEIAKIEYHKRIVFKFLQNKGTDAHNMQQRLQAQFGQDFYTFRTVQLWIGEIRRGRQDLHDENCTGRPPLDDLDAKILVILDKSPFESIRPIADTFRDNLAIVLRRLYDSIGFRLFHLH
jgi:hypothetical protein